MNFRRTLAAALVLTLAGCGGAGGGDAAPGVQPGPPPPGAVPPPAPGVPTPTITVAEIEDGDEVTSEIIGVEFASPPTITFSAEVDGYLTIENLTTSNVRFSFSRLVPGEQPDTLDWASLITTREDPVCRTAGDVSNANNDCTTFTAEVDPALIPQTALKVQDPVAIGKVVATQATTERNGTLSRNADGTWRYRMTTDPGDPAALTAMHRICIQYSLATPVHNPCIDFIPAEVAAADDGITGTSLEADFYATHDSRQVAATASCTTCHEALEFHGGGRREVDYCVACHNPGSSDAVSTNSVDLKVMIHRIHNGADLPSVDDGTAYKIWGFNNSEHDFSHIHFPQRVANCTRCHAGEEDYDAAEAAGLPLPDAVATADGHNWATKPTPAACGSCHENYDHFEDAEDECVECHSEGGDAGPIADAHADLLGIAARDFRYQIVSVTDTDPGDRPVIDFKVVNPNDGNATYDILNDPPFRQGGGASTLSVRLAWSTADYTNTRPGATNASSVSINALTQATNIGNDVFRVTSATPLPDGTAAPFVAATGSGTVAIEGHPAVELDPDSNGPERLPVANLVGFFSIDEDDGVAVSRRGVADLALCQNCHDSLRLHGANRSDNLGSCVTCHNPRNTDKGARAVAVTPPTDGKDEESLDFKTMIHGIHAAGMREHPLQIVGFSGFNTYVFDEEEVQFPGRLSNCATCHDDDSYALPLADTVLGTTVDTGLSASDPADDTVMSPITAVCSSCHDDDVAKSHMTFNGGAFATTQAALDAGDVVEQCEVCHREGSVGDLSVVHEVD